MTTTKSTENHLISSKNEDLNLNETSPELTFGPDSHWRTIWYPIGNWCIQHGFENIFKLLIVGFNLHGPELKVLAFKNVIDTLSDHESINILENWASNGDPISQSLLDLTTTIKNSTDPVILKLEHVNSDIKKAIPKSRYFLLNLFLIPKASNDSKYNQWAQTMRVWLLVHALYRVKRETYYDRNIRNASSVISGLIFHEESDWEILMTIRPNSEFLDFSNFNSQLIQHLSPIITTLKGKKRLRLFLGQIERIAGHIDDNDDDITKDHSTKDKLINMELFIEPVKLFEITEDDQYWLPIIPIESNNKEYGNIDGIARANVDHRKSYIHQELSVKSLFIKYDEYRHQLPWSWNRLTEVESDELMRWINDQFTNSLSHDTLHPLLAVITWLALNTGRTLVRALEFEIDKKPGREWTYIESIQSFARKTPSRNSSWIPKTELEKSWINERAEYNVLNLPSNIQTFLQKIILQNSSNSNSLRDIWNKLFAENIEVYFNKNIPTSLDRIKSGMLANSLNQEVFDRSNNPNFSQMISFHPQVALTGTYTYGDYFCSQTAKSTKEIHSCLDQNFNLPKNNVVALGSYFSPKENLLKEAINKATQKVLGINLADDPIQYHNQYSAYLMTQLWSCTGSRPVSDSFERPQHFNLENAFVFINDKATDERRIGRITPIATSLSSYLSSTYRQHLNFLSSALIESAPILAQEITLLVNGQPSGKLPYLFFLNANTLDWESITPSGIDKLDIFDWPLRHNLFRQRLAKILPKSGIEQTIVDAWLGHKDNKLDCYGDYSLSCLVNDIKNNRQKFEQAYSLLEFIDLPTWSYPPTINAPSKDQFKEKHFGIQKRYLARKEKQNKIIVNAKYELEILLKDKKTDDLSQNDIENIEKNLCSTPDGEFHPHALIRMAIFSDLIDDIWESNGKRFEIKHRYLRISDQFNPISEWAPTHFSLYSELNDDFVNLFNKIHASKTSINDSRIWVILALIFENRLCNFSMLEDIFNQNNFRLVKFKSQYYLEYSETLQIDDPFTPVERHLLTAKTAKLLHNLLVKKQSKFKYPSELKPLLDKIKNGAEHKNDKDFKYYIKRLSRITHNANSIELPGTLSAYLSRRVTSCSLNWIDWARISSHKIIQLPDQFITHQESSALDNILNYEISKYDSSAINKLNNEELLKSAKKFKDEFHNQLTLYSSSNQSQTVKALKKIIKKHQQFTSSTMILMGEWIIDLIHKGKNTKGSFKAYANSSPANYFSSVSHYFEQLAYDKDIITIDEDDITDLYNNYLSATKELKGTHHSDRLLSFHYFCRKKGVIEPDWNQINLPTKFKHVSPGILSEHNYLTVLAIIIGKGLENDVSKLHMSFFLILCYRFGLRSKEAIYLLRKDWVEINGSIYLLIRNNQYRKLKNEGSKRIVPLLVKLTKDERTIINSVLSHYDATHHTKDSKCIMSLGEEVINRHIPAIRRALINLLRQVTGNPKFVNHHLRHSFDNIISLALYNIDLPLFNKLISNQKIVFQNIKKITLGPQYNNLNTRNCMAVARLLGHTHPHTDAVSYQHFQDEWANQIHPGLNIKTRMKLVKAIDIDSFKTTHPISSKLFENVKTQYQPASISNILRFFSLVGFGREYKEAGELLSLDPLSITQLKTLIIAIDEKQNRGNIRGDTQNFTRPGWLTAIPSIAWKYLIALAEKEEKKNNIKSVDLIEYNRILEMVGQNRQITLWTKTHFINFKEFINYFNIPETSFNTYSYIDVNLNPVARLSEQYEFPLLESLKRRKDLDPGLSCDQPPGSYPSRINLIFKEDKKIPIKTSYQLTACLFAYFASCHLQKRPT